MHLGIDFGTTRTVVASCDRGNYPVASFQSEDGDYVEWYPSIIAERGGELRFGWAAAAMVSDRSWSVVRSFKRFLSDPHMRSDLKVRAGSSDIPLFDLLVGFLSALNRDLRMHSNLREALADVDRIPAMIATPANAHGTQRFFTIEAFRRAGFDVLALLNEPSAAGFEYAHRYRSSITSKREHIVVYDLGGGTFDASLVRMKGQHHDVAFTSGVTRLGGDDFDEVLADLVLGQMGMTDAGVRGPFFEDESMRRRLLDVCRESKEALGQASRRVLVDVESAMGSAAPVLEVALPASTFYDACAGLIDHTIDSMMRVVGHDDGVDGGVPGMSGVAGIYVVGGASVLPAVGRALRNRFGRRVHRSPYPSAAIAIGLAIAGDKEAGFRLTDRFSRAFGVFRELRDGTAVSFDTIFDKDARVPAPDEPVVSSTRAYRSVHNIGHFRYVECDSVDASGGPCGDITPLADAVFPFDPSLRGQQDSLLGVPIARIDGDGFRIEECYTIDSNGIVAVLIRNVDAGYERAFKLWDLQLVDDRLRASDG